jgi:hypothetical protein
MGNDYDSRYQRENAKALGEAPTKMVLFTDWLRK